jgi:hypothetical protein
VTNLAWIGEHLNVLLTGPTRVGQELHRLCDRPCRLSR